MTAMLRNTMWLGLSTLIPALELRASIPIGIFGMRHSAPWPLVVLVCMAANIVLG
jgi:hypothetical protein